MANEQHPITAPPELVEEWFANSPIDRGRTFATKAARWGADQELQACCEWLRNDGLFETRIGHLRAARRPKPPSLKEQALDQLRRVNAILQFQTTGGETSAIRRALEQLPDAL